MCVVGHSRKPRALCPNNRTHGIALLMVGLLSVTVSGQPRRRGYQWVRHRGLAGIEDGRSACHAM